MTRSGGLDGRPGKISEAAQEKGKACQSRFIRRESGGGKVNLRSAVKEKGFVTRQREKGKACQSRFT
jgi:hypothetical protein